MYEEYEIRQVPLLLKSSKAKIDSMLKANGLRSDDFDYYAGVFKFREDELLGGGGLKGNVIKCIAVGNELREHQMGLKLVSHLINIAVGNGHETVRLFTKPENKLIFESIGFTQIASSPKAILMEIGQNGIAAYCKYLSILKKEGKNGVIVMNANPFTHGHRYLIEQAAQEVDNLYVIAVKEDKSLFSYEERKAMIVDGCQNLKNVTVCEGSDYVISAMTFPTYFLKELSDASDTQMLLDLDIFSHHIAHALNASIRFVGTEPADQLTNRYNELMSETLPRQGIEVRIVDRLANQGGVVSASLLRRQIEQGCFSAVAQLAYPTTIPYVLGFAAADALKQELDLTPKPGLVDKNDSGAHEDMDYDLMNASIAALRPCFIKTAKLGYQQDLPKIKDIIEIGLKAEEDMYKATNGVNTHKGALFSIGLATIVASNLYFQHKNIDETALRNNIAAVACQIPNTNGTHGNDAVNRFHIKGALQNAQEGWSELFGKWLPFLRQHHDTDDDQHKTLLYIMTTLDDTNVYHRKGEKTVQSVKKEAIEALNDFSIERLEEMNTRFVRENISPGGCADMLSLTIYLKFILS